jgi:c-di-GMP-related signal transduction protein
MFCELSGEKISMFREAHEMFLLGLLSLVDALLNVRVVDMLAEIPVDDESKERYSASPVASARFL